MSDRAGSQPMTMGEAERQAERLRVRGMRERPQTLYAGSPSTIGEAMAAVNQQIIDDDTESEEAKARAAFLRQAIEGERDRHRRFRTRWGAKFRRSIIGRSLVAWQMHVCDLPVFELQPERPDGSRPAPRRLLRTEGGREAIRWFAGLGVQMRYLLCIEARSANAIDRQIRRKR